MFKKDEMLEKVNGQILELAIILNDKKTVDLFKLEEAIKLVYYWRGL